MERKSLGRGISALIPAKEGEPAEKIVYLKPEQIRPSAFQPRENFDPQSLEELSQSIKEKGVIQPVLVRRQGEAYELIAGERRFRAAGILGLKEIPAIIKEVSDEDSLELSLIENIQRQELNPIEEAHAYQYLLDKFNLTQEKISVVLGKARATIANTLRLLKLPQEIQEEIRKNRLSFAHGRALLEIEDENLQRRLAQAAIANSLSVRELENLIKRRRSHSPRRSPRPSEPLVAVLEDGLRQALATKVHIQKRKKRGQILIEFYSEEDLQRIVAKITAGR